MSQKIVLIDSYGFIFRAYHVQPPLTNPEGVPVGAIYGFCSMLIKILSDHNPTHIAAIFDSGSKTFRNEIYPEYKSHRPEVPKELIAQFPLTREVTKIFNIPSLEKENFEADDLIATLAKDLSSKGEEVIIVSSDKDLAQLMNPMIKIYDPSKGKFITEEDIHNKFGVTPDKIRDVLALMGDKSDNIPGVPGFGPKTAAELVNQFGNIENLLKNYEQISSERKRELVKNNIHNINISYELVGLRFDAYDEVEAKNLIWEKPNINQVMEFMKKMGFKSLDNRVKKICKNNDFNLQLNNNITAQLGAQSSLFDMQNENHLSDGSKTDLNLINCKNEDFTPQITNLLNSAKHDGILTLHMDDNYLYLGNKSISSKIKKEESNLILNLIEAFLNDISILKILYNVKEFKKIFESIKSYDDLEIMNYVLSAGSEKKNLESIFLYYFPSSIFSSNNINQILIQLHEILKENLFKNNFAFLYYDIDIRISEIIFEMEQKGVKFDVDKLIQLSDEFGQQISIYEQEIFKLSGENFNIASPKQLSEILFEKLSLPAGKTNQKSKILSTNVEILEKLSHDGYIIADFILKWRHFSKLKNTYTDAIPKLVNQNTKRVHTTFLQTSTTTGRLSSIEPNLQNIPIRTEEGSKIRASIIAEENYKLISADYSQIELRILSEIANIEALKTAFINNIDIHSHTASQIFNIDISEVSKDLRRKAKAINFGIIYGISAFGLAKQLDISRQEAKEYIEKYFIRYPGIKKYMDDTIDFATKNGYVENIFGRRCYVPNIHSSNNALKNFGQRAAINAPIQGTSADIVKIAMIQISEYIKKNNIDATLIMQIHDELVFEVRESICDEFAAQIKEIMENIYKFSSRLIVDISISDSWLS